MRTGAVLFVLALLGSAAAWFLLVRPIQDEAAHRAGEVHRADIAGAWARARAWPGPTASEERRLEEALSRFAPPAPAGPPPAGLRTEGKGVLTGTIPWGQVQALLAWASSRPEAVASLEVSAAPDAPELASCRVVLAEGTGR